MKEDEAGATGDGARISQRGDFCRWLTGTSGSLLLAQEQARVQAVLPNLFGYHLVQVGTLPGIDLMASSRILHRVVVEADVWPDESGLCTLPGKPDALPLASDSIDALILPHVLEFEARPHDALREVQRVLMPEGHALIFGFNPWGFMGLWRAALKRRGTAPWCGEFFSLKRLSDWLALLGFEIVSVNQCFFRPPMRRLSVMKRLQLMETLGPHLWPVFAGAYFVMAKKRVARLTPVRPSWRTRRRLVAVGLAEPTARIQRRE